MQGKGGNGGITLLNNEGRHRGQEGGGGSAAPLLTVGRVPWFQPPGHQDHGERPRGAERGARGHAPFAKPMAPALPGQGVLI